MPVSVRALAKTARVFAARGANNSASTSGIRRVSITAAASTSARPPALGKCLLQESLGHSAGQHAAGIGGKLVHRDSNGQGRRPGCSRKQGRLARLGRARHYLIEQVEQEFLVGRSRWGIAERPGARLHHGQSLGRCPPEAVIQVRHQIESLTRQRRSHACLAGVQVGATANELRLPLFGRARGPAELARLVGKAGQGGAGRALL